MGPNDTTSAVATLVILTLAYLAVGLGLYLWYGWALARLFRKLGTDGWRGWVPIVNEMTIFERGGVPPWNVVLYFVPIVNLYALYLKFVAAGRINERFGHGTGMSVLAVLVSPLWATIVGGAKVADAGVAQTRMADVAGHREVQGGLGAAEAASAPRTDQPGRVAQPPVAVAAPAQIAASSAGPLSPRSAPAAPTPPAPAPASAPSAPRPTLSPPQPLPHSSPFLAPRGGPDHAAAAGVPASPIAVGAVADSAQPGVGQASEPAAEPTRAAADDEHAPGGPPPIVVHNPWARPPQVRAERASPGIAVPSWLEDVEQAATPAASDDGAAGPPTPLPAPLPDADPNAAHADVDDDEDFGETVVVDRRPRVTWLLTVDGAGDLPLTSDRVILGRRPAPTEPGTQTLAVPDSTRTLSKEHARLELTDGEWSITDLGSTNGVMLVGDDGEETLIEVGEAALVKGRFVLGKVGMTIGYATEDA
ncbi:DUF5684 domain-containing protein [Demequina sp. NBRC 110053]|uniref:DUF5684 domain-containing protein n=1 Tax=Demequina sp. NBRC 110053 TaxID=1570342 RepID=UPI000A048415|nr:DUF5684 domain-containing protein [Demequina sp. NBRC 110053]